MNRTQFNESMDRILAFMAPPRTPEDQRNLEQYLKALYEQIAHWDAFMFEQVTKTIVKTLVSGRKPAVRDFEAIYSKMREALPKTEFKCVSCGTTGFISVWMLETKTGMTERFVKPCPDCRKNHEYARSPIRAGWVEMEGIPTTEVPESTKNFCADFFGIKAETPTDALEQITQLYRDGKVDVRNLVDVVASKVHRNNFNEERRKNKLVVDLVKSSVPEREASAESKNSVEVGSSGPAILTKPDEGGFFADGSGINDEDIPF